MRVAAKLKIDVGMVAGRLTAISRVDGPPKQAWWLCACSCGNMTKAHAFALTRGTKQSCGCLSRELSSLRMRNRCTTHGLSRDPMFAVWRSMNARCYNVRNKSFERYGARGISVCDRWRSSKDNARHEIGFRNFINDMGSRPSKRHSIERIDNALGYSPENCRWVLPGEQANNTRRNIFISAFGRTMTCAQWGREMGVSPGTIRARLLRGWDATEAVTMGARK